MKVNLQSLRNGVTSFEFDADVEDLAFDAGNFQVKAIAVKSKVDKSEHNLVITSDIMVKIDLICDSCLDEFTDEFEDSYTLLYTTEKEGYAEDEMVRFLNKGTQNIDLTEGLRESILLALPMRFKCSDECNGLCDQCGTNLNKKTCRCQKEAVDPRWHGLKHLLSERAGGE
ncbi:MAG: DUF177 domain-containing protein [bacterium]